MKSYLNPEFLNSPPARELRILSEYLEPSARLRKHGVRDTIVFFGSSRLMDMASAKLLQDSAETEKQKLDAKRAVQGAKYYEDARELARMLTVWAGENQEAGPQFVVTSGGGPGIMEAANRGAHEAGGRSAGFNISLPFEQQPNPYITPELSFDFHYFFMRKLWFAYLGKAIVIFPGGFGTLDEMFELLTLVQTDKLRKDMLVVVYGRDFWEKVVNFEALVEFGTISAEDLDLIHWADTPDKAFRAVTSWLKEKYL